MNYFGPELHQYMHAGDSTLHTVDGELVSQSFQNVFGGHDYYALDGSSLGSTHANIFGGHDHFGPDGQLTRTEIPNIFGGLDAYEGGLTEGHRSSWSVPNVFGGHDTYSGSELLRTSVPGVDGFVTVLDHHDPLMHIHDYTVPKLDL